MAIVDEITFRLERFGWSAPERLKLVGRWYGLPSGQSLLPTLVAHADGSERRLDVVPDSIHYERDGRWSAAFEWDPALADVSDVKLDLGNGLALELPQPTTQHRRFGRPVLRVYAVSVQADQPPTGESETAEVAAADLSRLDLHAALLKAQEDLDEARAEVERAQEEASLARRDAERERERRRTEAARVREVIGTTRALAEEQLDTERAAAEERLLQQRAEVDSQLALERAAFERRSAADQARLLAAHDEVVAQRDAEQVAAQQLHRQVEDISNRLAVERLTMSGLREEVDALRADVERAARREQAVAEHHAGEMASAHEDADAVRSQLASTQEELAVATEEGRRREQELDRLRSRLLEAQQLADDNRRLSVELDDVRRYAAELEPLRAQLGEASSRVQELEAVSDRLVEAERRVELIEPLQARLAEATGLAEQVEPLREQLAEALEAHEHATARAAEARRLLDAIRRALDGSAD